MAPTQRRRAARMTTPRLLFLRSAAAITKAADAELAKARKTLDSIKKARGPRTVANTLRPFNEIAKAIAEVGLQGQLLLNAHTDAAVRDAGNKAYLAADSLATELGLDRALYEAFAALKATREDAETRFALKKILRDFHRSGVDKDDATRARIKALNDAGVPCGPIYRIDEAFADPQVQHLAMAQPVHSAALGDLTVLGHPVSHGEKRLPIRTAAPELGQDNEEILTGIGYTKAHIADLAQRGVI